MIKEESVKYLYSQFFIGKILPCKFIALLKNVGQVDTTVLFTL